VSALSTALTTLRRRAGQARTLLRPVRGEELAPLGAVPESVAIIMDGNGRWARNRRLPVGAGHRAGAEALKRIVRYASDRGIRYLTVYSFSTENWSRPDDEVVGLMEMFVELIDRELDELHGEAVRMRFIGRREGLSEDLRRQIERAERVTGENTGMRFVVAMNYGGRAEILDAARRLHERYGPDATEEQFASLLYDPELRDPELLIRTSGELRLSNFLLWQSAYSELHFSERLWPEFRPEDLESALQGYARRERRFGGR
jgi:undecaprenyl diphosphate synthase